MIPCWVVEEAMHDRPKSVAQKLLGEALSFTGKG